ncbi:MAG: hypothetical protein Q6L68_06690 [Thermostichus sp. DG02_5_bins_236]
MKVEESSSGQLIVRQDASLGLALWVSVLSPLLALAPLSMASLTTFTCNRQAGSCEFTHQPHPFTAKQERLLPIETVREARLDTIKGRGGSPSTYRVSLAIQEPGQWIQQVPLQDYSRNAQPKERRAAEINHFLTDPQIETLSVIQDERWIQYFFSAATVVLGVGLALGFARRTTFILDHLLGSLTVQTQGLVYKKAEAFPLRDNLRVNLKAIKSGNMATAYVVELQIGLPRDPRSFVIHTSSNRESQLQLAEQIRQFLHLSTPVVILDEQQQKTPVQGSALLNLAMAGKAGRDEAIQTYRDALQLAPTDMATHQKLVMGLMMQKRGIEAREHLIHLCEQLESQGLVHPLAEAKQLLELLDSMQGKS